MKPRLNGKGNRILHVSNSASVSPFTLCVIALRSSPVQAISYFAVEGLKVCCNTR
jgi:hypothetical protein